MTSISLTALIRATGGTAAVMGERAVTAGLTTDSRRVVPGCVFLALSGERFDARDFR